MQDKIALWDLAQTTFSYLDGKLFWKTPSKYNQHLLGKEVGSLHKTGYLYVTWLKKSWKVHRLIWLYFNMCLPKGVIDHKDGNKLNNKLENLRDVSITENRQNQKKAQKNNVIGHLGIQQRGKTFRARIRVEGILHQLGTFNTLQEAIISYQEAKKLLHIGYIYED